MISPCSPRGFPHAMLRPQLACAAHLGSQPITPGGRGSGGAGHDPRQAGPDSVGGSAWGWWGW